MSRLGQRAERHPFDYLANGLQPGYAELLGKPDLA